MKDKTFKHKQDIMNWCEYLGGELLNSCKGFAAPFMLIKTNKAYNEIEVTSFSEFGKHASNWYMWPLNIESLLKKVEHNKRLLSKKLNKINTHR